MAERSLHRPQIGEPNRQSLKGLDLHDGFGAPGADDAVSHAVEPKHLQRLKERIDEPDMCDALSSVNRQLLRSVD